MAAIAWGKKGGKSAKYGHEIADDMPMSMNGKSTEKGARLIVIGPLAHGLLREKQSKSSRSQEYRKEDGAAVEAAGLVFAADIHGLKSRVK